MKKSIKKIIAGAIAISTIGTSSLSLASTYKVQPGDSYWNISQRLDISMEQLLRANNATKTSTLYAGSEIVIPVITHTVQPGESIWIISNRHGVSMNDFMALNNLNENTEIYPGQQFKVDKNYKAEDKKTIPSNNNNNNASIPRITYKEHIVKSGENPWTIGNKYGVPMHEILSANGLTQRDYLRVGQSIKIPVYNIPIKETKGERYGEYLDWFTEAQYVVPVEAVFNVVDFYTQKSFKLKRTIGANHADVEALTARDTAIIKEIWGGNFSWTSRPVIVEIDGRRIAASLSAMPHAGIDSEPGGAHVSSRSGGYGAGMNFDYVKGNNMDGHMDLYFSNSKGHQNPVISPRHERCVRIAAGLE